MKRIREKTFQTIDLVNFICFLSILSMDIDAASSLNQSYIALEMYQEDL